MSMNTELIEKLQGAADEATLHIENFYSDTADFLIEQMCEAVKEAIAALEAAETPAAPVSGESEREALAVNLVKLASDQSQQSPYPFSVVHEGLLRATVFWDRMVAAETDLAGYHRESLVPTAVEWGVRLQSRDAAYVSESDARDLAAHYDGPLLKRMVSAWEVQA